jgi:hypothetical protein
MGVEVQLLIILDFDNRWGEWSALRPVHFTTGETSLVLAEGEAEWVPEAFWTPWIRGKSFASTGD